MITSQPADRTEQNLNEALAHVVQEIARTDNKSGLVLSLTGILSASLAILAQAKSSSLLVLTPAAGLLATATLLALLVIRPHMGADDRSSFAYWATRTTDQLLTDLAPDRRPDRLRILSGICHRKMRLLRLATSLTIAALVALAAAALVTAA
ncbi:Pycsar system effector family protein [Kitasatospora sp. NPDC051853]|uniref:Pycsar system effector family protein n=1 Tax=Kitasatospora sp. NPDC051853 TaxID=3364058 RepID=UPI0037A50700